ncbi:hypothetical protein LG198_13415 [Methylobacillus arboreus]|uniref:hypothetical protein n=1 Tax=Methylobacillus arboreus TaxID=755170 RepID=UPI001E657D81|nr:hypothetical protein [Methylobacillus arboreus]MCB5191732.1 hypothetical protein [Methylobacillus arboreus]
MASNIKKTHPMVLVAATALTVFSLVGSAAITGLIPVSHTYRPDLAQELITDPNAAMVISNTLNQEMDNHVSDARQISISCNECGTIVSIRPLEERMSAVHKVDQQATAATYIIKVKMGNGSFHTITQDSTPHHSVGDMVKLRSGRLVNA